LETNPCTDRRERMTIGTHRSFNEPTPKSVALSAPAPAPAPAIAPTPDDDPRPAEAASAASAATEPSRATDLPPAPLDPESVPWTWAAGVMLALLGLYGILQNGLFVSNSDGEYYISVARNIALGRGYQYNGQPVGLVPPGWPLVLAGAMRVSGSFAFLTWVTAVLMVAAGGLWFRALLRWTTPRRAAIVTLLGFTLFWGYHSAILLQSEALFCALLAWAVLLALQVAEGRPGWWRVAVLVLLCAALVSVRWAGVLTWAVVGAILLSGEIVPRANRRWAAAVLTAAATIGAFVGIRHGLRQLGADAAPATVATSTSTTLPAGAVVVEEVSEAPGSPDGDGPGVVRNVDTDKLSRDLYDIMPSSGLPLLRERLGAAGVWAGTAFWMPAKVAVSDRRIAAVVNVFGWGLIAVMGVWAVSLARRRQWVGLGVLAYGLMLVVRWSSANERYLLPLAPLLILGVWWGMERAAALRPAVESWPWWRPTCRALAAALIGSVALCNATLYGIDAYIARSSHFYDLHHGGRTRPLVDMAAYLTGRDLRDGELAVSPLYININRPAANSFGIRVMNVLTDRTIRTVPRQVCEGEPNDALLAWAGERGVRYYLYYPPVSPWRVWHFRMPWLQRMVTGETAIPNNPHWVLYALEDGRAVKVDPPPSGDWPTRLPGL